MNVIRKAAAVAAIVAGALAIGVSGASAEPSTTTEACPPGHVYHPVEGCIPVSPGPY